MKKVGIIFIVIGMIFLCSCSTTKMVRINFAMPADGVSLNIKPVISDTLVGSDKLSGLKEYPSYKMDFRGIDDRLKKIKAAMDFESSLSSKTELYTQYSDKDFICQVYDNGNIYCYKNNWMFESAASMSDEQAKKTAITFMQENRLLPEGFSMDEKVRYANSGGTVTAKIVHFNRKINGIDVLGMSVIRVGINNNGIVSYQSAYSDYSTELKTSIIALDNAQQKLQEHGDVYEYDSNVVVGKPVKVEIKKVDMVYYEDSTPNSKQNYIQPCYRFSGLIYDEKGNSAEYISLVKAVPDSLTVAK